VTTVQYDDSNQPIFSDVLGRRVQPGDKVLYFVNDNSSPKPRRGTVKDVTVSISYDSEQVKLLIAAEAYGWNGSWVKLHRDTRISPGAVVLVDNDAW
jgi:hypothetical protein